jgi:hypothetical protein
MEPNQNDNIDFSNYAGKSRVKVAALPVLGEKDKRKKIQIIVIAACLLLAAVFWGYYFYQQNAQTRTVNYDVSGEMVPE